MKDTEPTCLNNASTRAFVVGKVRSIHCGPRIFLIWTIFWATWHLIWFLVDLLALTQNKPGKYFRYLTNWGYILLVITSMVDFLTTLFTLMCCKTDVDENAQQFTNGREKKTSKYLFPTWICFDTAKCIALYISVGYYSVLAFAGNPVGQSAKTVSSVMFHGINSVYIILNLLISTKPVGMHHFIFSILFAGAYIGLSFFLQFAFGIKPPYENVDFINISWSTVGFVVGCFVVPVVIHFLIYYCKTRCFPNKVDEINDADSVNDNSIEPPNGMSNNQQHFDQQHETTVINQGNVHQNVWYAPNQDLFMTNTTNGFTTTYTGYSNHGGTIEITESYNA